MKEQYIKQVRKGLSLPRNVKKEVLRDLDEAFASALEHGETEQQVIQRLGPPREFADSAAGQFGVDNAASKKWEDLVSVFSAFSLAALAFSIYAFTRSWKAPKGAIGQADAMTTIRIEGALGLDVSQIILAAGSAAAVIAAISIIRIMRKTRGNL